MVQIGKTCLHSRCVRHLRETLQQPAPYFDKNLQKNKCLSPCHQLAICGAAVRSGRRQSIPSNNIDNCARVSDTVQFSARGHTKRPRSRRLDNKHSPAPSLSHHNTFSRSPRRPRNTNTCPENGSCSNAVCTRLLSPVNPRRRSVTPA